MRKASKHRGRLRRNYVRKQGGSGGITAKTRIRKSFGSRCRTRALHGVHEDTRQRKLNSRGEISMFITPSMLLASRPFHALPFAWKVKVKLPRILGAYLTRNRILNQTWWIF